MLYVGNHICCLCRAPYKLNVCRAPYMMSVCRAPYMLPVCKLPYMLNVCRVPYILYLCRATYVFAGYHICCMYVGHHGGEGIMKHKLYHPCIPGVQNLLRNAWNCTNWYQCCTVNTAILNMRIAELTTESHQMPCCTCIICISLYVEFELGFSLQNLQLLNLLYLA